MARFLALRQLQVGDDVRQRGDEVPEAEGWRDLSPWVSNGYIEVFHDDEHGFGRRKAELAAEVARDQQVKEQAIRERNEAEAAAGVQRETPLDLNRMTVPALVVFARAHDVPVTGNETKPELIDKLNAFGHGRQEA